jgi:hypothetical protein
VLPSEPRACRGHRSGPFRPGRALSCQGALRVIFGRVGREVHPSRNGTSLRGACLAATPTFRPAVSAAAAAQQLPLLLSIITLFVAAAAVVVVFRLPSNQCPPDRRTPTCPP